MSSRTRTTIIGTGSYIPSRQIPNSDFLDNEFLDSDGQPLDRSNEETIEKFQAITGIQERRYVTEDQTTSDIATEAARDALKSSGVDAETLDHIIVAHNFGDVSSQTRWSDFVPTLASRVKQKLGIKNPLTVPYDLPFGCPGWLQGIIHADIFLKSGEGKRALVIGAETLSRVTDKHDRDSMIYADGAGACIVEGVETDREVGFLSHLTRSDTLDHAYDLHMDRSFSPESNGSDGLYLKMEGHRVYEYALRTVPKVIRECVNKAGVTLRDIAKVLVHQANAKMDDAIVKRLYKMCGMDEAPHDAVPMTISWLGNSSVATLPTLVDLILKGKLKDHSLNSGDTIVFASVGAGMNINAMVYRLP